MNDQMQECSEILGEDRQRNAQIWNGCLKTAKCTTGNVKT